MRLFRQSPDADWKTVISDLVDALQILCRRSNSQFSAFLETLRC
jgi:hypothetical protein